jgi:hypothetical protein
VIDRHGQEVTRARLDCIYPNNIYDGSSDELWERLLIGFLAPFGFSPAFSWRTEIDKETWEELQWEDWPDPTPALIQTPHTQDKRPWVIVADSRCALNAFTWDPVARTLELKWSIDDPADARYSSPTVSPEGFLAVGTSTGFVKAYRLDSGVPWWEYATGEAMIGTPLFSRGHSYNYCFASSDTHLYELVPNGTLSRKIDLHGSTKASPAQSRDRVYISSTAGLFSYPYIGPGGGGVSVPGLPFLYDTKPSGKSSPAIAPNGAIYNVTQNYLRAYQRFDPP